MAIWKQPPSLEAMNTMCRDTAVAHLGIEYSEVGDDFLAATMPVDSRTVQPARLLHGGASVLLAESLGSLASQLVIGSDGTCVGLEINANHIRGARSGKVTGICRPIHLGRTTHVWDIRISDEGGKLVCIARLTMAILAREA